MKKINGGIILLLIISFTLVGCTEIPGLSKPTPTPTPKPAPATPDPITTGTGTITEQLAKQSNIKKFSNLEELSEFLENNQTSSSGYGYLARGLGMGMDMAFEEAMPLSELKSVVSDNIGLSDTGGGGSDDFSQTNVQVEGVDEADIIKTDGKYVYALSKNNLFIINAYPAEDAEILSIIEFKSRPQDIYINEDRLVVFGRDQEIYQVEKYSHWRRRGAFTFFKVFDISDPKNPKQVRDLNFEGSYNNSRMIGDYVYFVTSNYSYYFIPEEPVLPRILQDGEELTSTCAEGVRCFAPEIYYFDIPYQNYNFTSVTAINVKDNSQIIDGDFYLMTGNQNMYVSPANIYITYTKYISEYQLEMEVMKELIFPRLSAKDQERIRKIEAVENFILTRDEKIRKITEIIQRHIASLSDEEQSKLEGDLEAAMKQKYTDISKELEKTVIHKIAINGADLKYQTNGEVTGHVLNQFSMDEHDSYFRIATTKNRTWSRFAEEENESYSNVFILDKDLKLTGELTNLAPGERIYSVRFMQGRAYLVTFKQVDPLFVVDLSDPVKPKVLGELKIPGFSNYLHPYDDTRLIGFGKDTAETEWGGVRTKGLKLSLFDVSEVSEPKEIDTYIMGDAGSNSIALNDHKAWLFSRDKNLLVIPVSIREVLGDRSYGKLSFVGAAVLKVDEEGFELKGKIDHSDGGRAAERDYWRGYSYYDNTVKRSLYIDDVLYTLSNQYLKMNKLEDLNLVKNLKLDKKISGQDDDFIIIN